MPGKDALDWNCAMTALSARLDGSIMPTQEMHSSIGAEVVAELAALLCAYGLLASHTQISGTAIHPLDL